MNDRKALIIALVIAIIIILGLAGYLCYEKGIILATGDNKTVEKNNVEEKKEKNTETKEEKDEIENLETDTFTSKLKSSAYVTEDERYLLILNEYNRDWNNPKISSSYSSFTLSLSEGYSVENTYGYYNINGDKLELIVTNAEGSLLTCILNTLGVEVIENRGQYQAILAIKDNTVIVGNTTLYMK